MVLKYLPEPSTDSSHISNTDASTCPPTKLLCLVYWLNKSNETRKVKLKNKMKQEQEVANSFTFLKARFTAPS